MRNAAAIKQRWFWWLLSKADILCCCLGAHWRTMAPNSDKLLQGGWTMMGFLWITWLNSPFRIRCYHLPQVYATIKNASQGNRNYDYPEHGLLWWVGTRNHWSMVPSPCFWCKYRWFYHLRMMRSNISRLTYHTQCLVPIRPKGILTTWCQNRTSLHHR